MRIEKIKAQLKDGLFTLLQDNEQPANMCCFATFKYENGGLYINGQIEEIGFEESHDNDTFTLSTYSSTFIFYPNKVICDNDGENAVYVFGDNMDFISAKTRLDNLLPKTDKLASINAFSEYVYAQWGYHGVEINRTEVILGHISQVDFYSKHIFYTNKDFYIQDGIDCASIVYKEVY